MSCGKKMGANQGEVGNEGVLRSKPPVIGRRDGQYITVYGFGSDIWKKEGRIVGGATKEKTGGGKRQILGTG